jgi:choline dehydrogenase-like flavoprotein
MSTVHAADVVIVGSGVAGSLLAHRLAAAGVRVLVLEAGPRVDRGESLRRFEHALVKVPSSPYPRTSYAPFPTEEQPDGYYLQSGPDTFASGYLRQVGGTTWHWLGSTPRFVPDDFRLKTRFGLAVDWPLTYDDLEPWYCEAERELGVAGDSSAGLGEPRSRPYPLPPIPLSYSDRRVAAALAGSAHVVQPTPQARNSVAYDQRPPCCGSSSCIPICPIQAKYDATVHVARAERAGAQLVDRAVVHAIDVGADGRVSGLRFLRPDGTEERAVATTYVIAAHGIETPKLLLQSRTASRPAGVANSSDQVGRHLMDHPSQLSWAMAVDVLGGYRGPLSTAGIEAGRMGTWRAERPAWRTQIDNAGWSWARGAPVGIVRELLDRGLRGPDLDETLAREASRHISLATMTEQLPLPENRIVPDFEHRDALGLPRPRIAFRYDDYTRHGLARARQLHDEVFTALGTTERHHDAEVKGASHLMGTCRMGTDPRTSVVGHDLRAHDHPNLFVVGSAVFPTGGASNPTLTIAALALRAVTAVHETVRAGR